MAVNYKVSDLKAWINSIPAASNNTFLEVPDDMVITAIESRTIAPNGTIFYTVRGYMMFATRTWVPSP